MNDWRERVERWSQLDEPAQCLCATYWEKREHMGPLPDWLLLASPGASNHSDARFARSPIASPSRFVHTLPNVRGAALLQAMNWSGVVLCIQNDPLTIETALDEAVRLSRSGLRVWVAGAKYENEQWHAEFYVAAESEITKK